MIVGTKVIPKNKLKEACNSIAELQAFSLRLVPRVVQHVTGIVDNQKYLVALEVRQLQGIPFSVKRRLTEGLLRGVYVRGSINTFVDLEDILSNVNYDKVLQNIFEKELTAYERGK